MTVVVRNPNCRKCGRALVDQSDLWAGICNNDEACKRRVEQAAEATKRGVAGDHCATGNSCGRLGCPECQQ